MTIAVSVALIHRREYTAASDMQSVLADQPLIGHAVRCLSLCDVLELQLELLRQTDRPDFEHPEPLPPNVIRFRPRRRQ